MEIHIPFEKMMNQEQLRAELKNASLVANQDYRLGYDGSPFGYITVLKDPQRVTAVIDAHDPTVLTPEQQAQKQKQAAMQQALAQRPSLEEINLIQNVLALRGIVARQQAVIELLVNQAGLETRDVLA